MAFSSLWVIQFINDLLSEDWTKPASSIPTKQLHLESELTEIELEDLITADKSFADLSLIIVDETNNVPEAVKLVVTKIRGNDTTGKEIYTDKPIILILKPFWADENLSEGDHFNSVVTYTQSYTTQISASAPSIFFKLLVIYVQVFITSKWK